jgi:hypothetical protein
MTDPADDPFVPLPMVPPRDPPSSRGVEPRDRDVVMVYVRYRDPTPLEFPGRSERLPGPIFHAAGVLVREDDRFLALGEIAFADENSALVQRYGVDLFPAYRNILTIPKDAIVERRDTVVSPARPRLAEERSP